jgi:hypothetical protein
MDIKTVFLHGVLTLKNYMNQPLGFEKIGTKH